MNSESCEGSALEIPNLLQPPNSLTGQKLTELPSKLSWVQEILDFLRSATKRLHPQPIVEEGEKKIFVKFYHLRPFNEAEVEHLKNMTIQLAEERDRQVQRFRVTKQWVQFESPK